MLLGINLMMAARFAGIVAALAAAWFVFDAVGDLREAKVWGKINAAIAKTNADIDATLSLDDKIARVAQDAREKALSNATRVLPAVGQVCTASPEQAAALSQIK